MLWRFGPGAYKRTLEGLVRRPLLTRALAVVEFGAGLWPALGQYEQR
ncbi:MAG: hypothetical protein M3533_11670 [Actinomycetota bacterium]|nr:hypothetical protein [Actinomycetota bacterium]